MTRKQLEELGLTKEQADKVMEINGGDIENAEAVAIGLFEHFNGAQCDCNRQPVCC